MLAKDKGIIKALRRVRSWRFGNWTVLSRSGLWRNQRQLGMLAMSPPELSGSVETTYPVILLGKRYSVSLPGGLAGVQGLGI